MNILTFDIEEWAITKARTGITNAIYYSKYDNMLGQVLDLLEQHQLHATCFCTGEMAIEFPQVVQLIASKGHEIACHSHTHQWCNKMSAKAFNEDTYKAIDSLEQCIGQKIKGYRAPAFSITEKTPYAFEILHKHGITYDASIFPCSRDFGGFPSFGYQVPTRIKHEGIEIYEFPIPTTNILSKNIAWSGGGYFRMFPFPIIQHYINQSNYVMSYFHLKDLIAEPMRMMTRERYEEYFKESGTFIKRINRMIKGGIAIGNTYNKLEKLIKKNKFINIQTAISSINWDKTPIKQL